MLKFTMPIGSQDLMTDSDNGRLLRPLNRDRTVPILPAVDPVNEPNGAQGVVVAQVFAIKAGSVDGFARAAESTFAKYRAAGAREAGVLVTLDVKNNFPRNFRYAPTIPTWCGSASYVTIKL